MSAFSSGSKIDRARQLSESRPAIPRPKSIGRHDLSPLDKPPSLRVSPDDGVAVLATAIEPAPLQLQSGARDLSTVSARHCPLRRVGQKFGREPLQPWDHPAVFDVQMRTPSTRIENFQAAIAGAGGRQQHGSGPLTGGLG